MNHGLTFSDAEDFFIGIHPNETIIKNKWELSVEPEKARILISKGDKGSCNINIYDDLDCCEEKEVYLSPSIIEAKLVGAINRDDCIKIYKTVALSNQKIIGKNIDNNQFSFYPNPASNSITFKINNIEKYSIVMYNLLGKKIKEVNVNTGDKEYVLDIRNIARGGYIISYKSNSQSTVKYLIVK